MIWRYAKPVLVGIVLLGTVAASIGLLIAQSNDSRLLSVQSQSMAPALQKGDLITVTRVSVGQLAEGDVVTFVNPQNRQQTITHRIVQLPSEANNQRLVTKGDANANADTPIAPSSIVGKVNQRLPLAGHAVDFVRKPLGLILIIYIPALMVLAHELRLLIRHYKLLQPYHLHGRQERKPKITGKQRFAAGAKLSVFLVVIALAVAIPVKAALLSEAVLVGNTISTIPGTAPDNILLRRVEFECTLDNTEQVNKLPGIIMHNPTDRDKNTGNWYIESSEGRLVTFRPQTVFDSHDDYDIQPDLLAGVHYEGDFLALFDSTGTLVDAISWGTDTTYMNPTLPGTQDRTVFRRIDLVFDTDTAVDWSVSVAECDPDHL
jgi:signal peptidase I